MRMFEEHIFEWLYKLFNRKKLKHERELLEDVSFREKMAVYDRNIEICVRNEYRAALKLETGLLEEIKLRKELLRLCVKSLLQKKKLKSKQHC